MKAIAKFSCTRLTRRWPRRFAHAAQTSPLSPLPWLERLDLRRAIRSGPPYRPSHQSIIIDITLACDLHCIDCNRSCGTAQASSREAMTLDQIERFIAESITQGRRWKTTALEGGEPTQHPQLAEIIALLEGYRRRFSPRTNISLLTNGHTPRARKLADALHRRGIFAVDTRKQSPYQAHHCAFNLAPVMTRSYAMPTSWRGCPARFRRAVHAGAGTAFAGDGDTRRPRWPAPGWTRPRRSARVAPSVRSAPGQR